MIVLHAGWHDGQLLLWGETPLDVAPATPSRRGRKPKTPAAAPFPFAAAEPRLATALKFVPWLSAAPAGPTEQAVFWAPTVKQQPIASSPLIAAPPAAADTVSLAPWTITALPL